MLVDHSTITCCREGCGISFMVPSRWQQDRRNDHAWFYCPNGHRQHYPGESDEEKLRRERDNLAQRIAERDDTINDLREQRNAVNRQLSATRGVVTRVKNRIGHGVCPCCNRTFENLARHMATQHGDFARSTE